MDCTELIAKMNRECMVVLEKMPICSCNKCSDAFHNTKDMIVQDNSRDDQFLRHVSSAYVKVEKSNWDCGEYKQYFRNKSKPRIRNRREDMKVKPELSEYYTPVKSYKCPECDFTFVAETTLQKHSILHRPFPHICHCGIGFYKSNDLKEHKIVVHDADSDSSLIEVKPKPIIRHKVGRKSVMPDVILPPLDIKIIRNDHGDYQCPECRKWLKSKISVEKHYRAVHKGERPYVCKQCKKGFSQIAGLNMHILIHVGKNNFKCQYCDKAFLTRDRKNLHERIHTGYKPHKCMFCEKAFSDPSALARHERIHTKDKRCRCPYCPSAFTDSSALYQHKLRHENKREFKCEKCPRSFYSKSDLRKHVSVVHDLALYFTCDYCGEHFSFKNNLMSHIQSVHVKRRPQHKCPNCVKAYYTKQGLKDHIETVHVNALQYTCEICFKQYGVLGSYERHMKVHINGKIYECNDCPKKYHHKGTLTTHIMSAHNPSLYCKQCERKFRTKQDLKKHKFVKSQCCEICNKIFICEPALTKHLKKHMRTPKKYECDYCNKIFYTRSSLMKHISQYHCEPKYNCSHCGVWFALKCSLRNHMLTHLKLVRCKVCFKRLASKVDLQSHKKRGCTRNTYTCEVCNKSFLRKLSYKYHINIHNEKRKKVKCPVCDKEFSNKAGAVRHVVMFHTKKQSETIPNEDPEVRNNNVECVT